MLFLSSERVWDCQGGVVIWVDQKSRRLKFFLDNSILWRARQLIWCVYAWTSFIIYTRRILYVDCDYVVMHWSQAILCFLASYFRSYFWLYFHVLMNRFADVMFDTQLWLTWFVLFGMMLAVGSTFALVTLSSSQEVWLRLKMCYER